jgi:hypothetical protein
MSKINNQISDPPGELRVLAKRARVRISPSEWALILPPYRSTREAIDRLAATLRPEDGPAIDFLADRSGL